MELHIAFEFENKINSDIYDKCVTSFVSIAFANQ